MDKAKAVVAIVVSLAGALVVGLGTGNNQGLGDLDWQHWLIAALTVLGSGGIVWLTENIDGVAGGIIKTVVGFLSAGIASLVVALNDGHVTQAELLVAFVAAVSATGLVYQTSPEGAKKVAAKLGLRRTA